MFIAWKSWQISFKHFRNFSKAATDAHELLVESANIFKLCLTVRSRTNLETALESRDDPWPDPLSCFTPDSSISRCKIAWLCSCATSSLPRWEVCCPKPWSCVPVLQRRWKSWIPRAEPCLETGFLARVSQVPFCVSTPADCIKMHVHKFNDTTVCFVKCARMPCAHLSWRPHSNRIVLNDWFSASFRWGGKLESHAYFTPQKMARRIFQKDKLQNSFGGVLLDFHRLHVFY